VSAAESFLYDRDCAAVRALFTTFELKVPTGTLVTVDPKLFVHAAAAELICGDARRAREVAAVIERAVEVERRQLAPAAIHPVEQMLEYQAIVLGHGPREVVARITARHGGSDREQWLTRIAEYWATVADESGATEYAALVPSTRTVFAANLAQRKQCVTASRLLAEFKDAGAFNEAVPMAMVPCLIQSRKWVEAERLLRTAPNDGGGYRPDWLRELWFDLARGLLAADERDRAEQVAAVAVDDIAKLPGDQFRTAPLAKLAELGLWDLSLRMSAALESGEARTAATRGIAIEMARAGHLYRARRTVESLGTDDQVPVHAAIAAAHAQQHDPVLGPKLFPKQDRTP
jgi:hypothetical protein